MNILILNWKDIKHPQAGGAEVIAFELARRMVQKGNSVTFFCQSFKGAASNEEIDGICVIRKGNKFSVYLHSFFYYISLVVKPDKVIDMINTICWQTPLYVDRNRRIAYLNQLAKNVWFYELTLPKAILGYLFERLEYFTYKTTTFICYSESTKKDLTGLGIPSSHIRTFNIGIDHKRYFPIKNKSETPLFILVSRLVKMKRAILAVKAMNVVLQRYPDSKLLIIGNGPQEGELIGFVKKNRLSANVKFVTKNNFFFKKSIKDLKVKFMQEAWCLLMPSVKEGWGLVVTEAAACGTPAIVSNATGLRDSVINGKTGIVISKNPTPHELAEAMIFFIKDGNLRETLSKNAVIFAREFTWERSFKEFWKILGETN